MGSLIVGNHGVKNGIQTFRINGSKLDIERIVLECIEMGHTFAEDINIEHIHRGQYSLLLTLKLQ